MILLIGQYFKVVIQTKSKKNKRKIIEREGELTFTKNDRKMVDNDITKER